MGIAKFNMALNVCRHEKWVHGCCQLFNLSLQGGYLTHAHQYPKVSNGSDWIQTNILNLCSDSDQIGQFSVKCRAEVNEILFSILFVVKTTHCIAYIEQCLLILSFTRCTENHYNHNNNAAWQKLNASV